MTLLLGPPSSGKTTMLLALAGRLSSSLQVRHEKIMELRDLQSEITNYVGNS